MEIKIKKAGAEDCERIAALESLYTGMKSDKLHCTKLKRALKSVNCCAFSAIDQSGVIQGFVLCFLRHFKKGSGRIFKIIVDPSQRRQGIGEALLVKAENWFKEQGMIYSCAEVRESNQASRAMFLKKGYEETGLLPAYYPAEQEGLFLENGIKYKKNLY